MWESLLIKFAIGAISNYIESSSSKSDDRILSIVQEGASYLAKKPNNTIDSVLSSQLEDKKMLESKTLQKVR